MLNTASLKIQLELQIRDHIGKYYEQWTTCDDPTCGNRTRSMCVYGRQCLRQGCRGRVSFEVQFLCQHHESEYLLISSASVL